MLSPNSQAVLDTLQSIAETFYNLVDVDADTVTIPPLLQGTELYFYYPFRNRSLDLTRQSYSYLHYDGEKVIQRETSIENVGQDVARVFAFLIQNAVLHPQIADFILKNAAIPLQNIADLKRTLAHLFGKEGLKNISIAIRTRPLLLSAVLLKSRSIKTTDGFEFLQERVARDDFDAYCQFVVQLRIAYYLHNYRIAQAVNPERCPFDHQILEEATPFLPLILAPFTDEPINQAMVDIVDDLGLKDNVRQVQRSFLHSLSSGAFLLNNVFYDDYSHLSPFNKFIVIDSEKELTYRFSHYEKLLAHVYGRGDAQEYMTTILPEKMRVLSAQSQGREYLFPMLGHCPELVWGGLTLRPNFQLSPENTERLNHAEIEWKLFRRQDAAARNKVEDFEQG